MIIELARKNHDLSDIFCLSMQEDTYDHGEFLNKYLDNINSHTKIDPFPKITEDDPLFEKELNKGFYLLPIISFTPDNTLNSSMDCDLRIDTDSIPFCLKDNLQMNKAVINQVTDSITIKQAVLQSDRN